jgi:hypothetical protein
VCRKYSLTLVKLYFEFIVSFGSFHSAKLKRYSNGAVFYGQLMKNSEGVFDARWFALRVNYEFLCSLDSLKSLWSISLEHSKLFKSNSNPEVLSSFSKDKSPNTMDPSLELRATFRKQVTYRKSDSPLHSPCELNYYSSYYSSYLLRFLLFAQVTLTSYNFTTIPQLKNLKLHIWFRYKWFMIITSTHAKIKETYEKKTDSLYNFFPEQRANNFDDE